MMKMKKTQEEEVDKKYVEIKARKERLKSYNENPRQFIFSGVSLK